MADEPQAIRSINWLELFPFLHLFRAFRVAAHPSKIVLGLAALLVLYAGGRVLDAVWPAKHLAMHGEIERFESFGRQEIPGEFANVQERGWEAHRAAYARLIQLNWNRDGELAEALKTRDEAKKKSAEITEPSARSERELEIDRNFDRTESGILVTYNRGMDSLPAGGPAPSKEATEAAREFGNVSDIKGRIALGRDRMLALAERRRTVALADASKEADVPRRETKEREAREQYFRDERAAFEAGASHFHTLNQLLPHGIFDTFLRYEVDQVNSVVSGVIGWNWTGGLMAPAAPTRADAGPDAARLAPAAGGDGVIRSVINFFAVGPVWLYRFHLVYAILFTLLFLAVWAVFGGAIARIAAVHVARDEKISVRQALRFSVSKLLSFVFAPLIPLLIVLGIGALLAAGGLLFYIPLVGPMLAGAFMILALLGGVLITLVLFGTVAGLNLMYPTVAVEGSDSFDGISRSFSYVFARPWRMLFYTLVALAYGAITYLFVRFFIYVVLAVTHFFVGWWLFGQPGRWYPQMWPTPGFTELPYDLALAGLKWSEDVAAVCIAIWVYLLIALLGAFAISFYFSANTIIYYLMRREVDATEMEDVYVEEQEDDFADSVPMMATEGAAGQPTPEVGAPAAVTAPPSTPSGDAGGDAADSGPPIIATPGGSSSTGVSDWTSTSGGGDRGKDGFFDEPAPPHTPPHEENPLSMPPEAAPESPPPSEPPTT